MFTVPRVEEEAGFHLRKSTGCVCWKVRPSPIDGLIRCVAYLKKHGLIKTGSTEVLRDSVVLVDGDACLSEAIASDPLIVCLPEGVLANS